MRARIDTNPDTEVSCTMYINNNVAKGRNTVTYIKTDGNTNLKPCCPYHHKGMFYVYSLDDYTPSIVVSKCRGSPQRFVIIDHEVKRQLFFSGNKENKIFPGELMNPAFFKPFIVVDISV
jgi:hypothetical protein